MKSCTECGEVKQASEFYKCSKVKSGLKSNCKQCDRNRAKRYREQNPEKSKFAVAAWRLKNTEHERQYRANNSDRISANFARWASNNTEMVKATQARFRERNRNKRRNQEHLRRVRKTDSSAKLVTERDLRKLLLKPCIYCGAKSAHIDHIIPLARGGTHSVGNLAPACQWCNLSKNSKYIMEWKKGRKWQK